MRLDSETIQEVERGLLHGPAPSLGLFANVGGANLFTRTLTQDGDFSFGEQSRIHIKADINQSMRAFYFCLVELCFSPSLPEEVTVPSLNAFRSLAYSPSLEGLLRQIPCSWLKAHPNLSLRRLLADFFSLMAYNRGNSLAILNQYPAVDIVLCAMFRARMGLETQHLSPALKELLECFGGLVECYAEDGRVCFPQLDLRYDPYSGDLINIPRRPVAS